MGGGGVRKTLGGEEEVTRGGAETEEEGVEEHGGGVEDVTVGGVEIEEEGVEAQGGVVAVEGGEAPEGGVLDEGGGREVGADQEDEQRIGKVLAMEHNTSEYSAEEELIEPGEEEGDGGDMGEGEVEQLEIVLGRGEDANGAMSGEWG